MALANILPLPLPKAISVMSSGDLAEELVLGLAIFAFQLNP